MFDILKASFPGDSSTGTAKRRIEAAHFHEYSKEHLWQEGSGMDVDHAQLHVPPALTSMPADSSQARPTAPPRRLDRTAFDSHMARYWDESTFSYTDGVPVVLDLVLSLGRSHSTDTANLQAFKSLSHVALRTELDSLLRFGHARRETIQFFHTTDSSHWNYHLHNLIFLT
ncbi:hypothetical protein OAF93_01895 [Planctomycetota bacterium]|nr:hypothetical protein [Planctomycetota bacterium]